MIRSILVGSGDSSSADWFRFDELNHYSMARNSQLNTVGTNDILDFSIAKPRVNYAARLPQTYQTYDNLEIVIPGNKVMELKKAYSMNDNMVAFSIFSLALGRAFDKNKVIVNCTESGRNHEACHLKGLGMMARYFPCCVSLPKPRMCTDTASSIVNSYWIGFYNDFSSYLSRLRQFELETKSRNFQFAYNYDGYVAKYGNEPGQPYMESASIYPKIGIFDIVVNVCTIDDLAHKQPKPTGLLFKIDYSPTSISKEQLHAAFNQ